MFHYFCKTYILDHSLILEAWKFYWERNNIWGFSGFQGGITHQDFAGHKGTIHTGDVQVKNFFFKWFKVYMTDLILFLGFHSFFSFWVLFSLYWAVDDSWTRDNSLWNACWRRCPQGFAALDQSVFSRQNVRNFEFILFIHNSAFWELLSENSPYLQATNYSDLKTFYAYFIWISFRFIINYF